MSALTLEADLKSLKHPKLTQCKKIKTNLATNQPLKGKWSGHGWRMGESPNDMGRRKQERGMILLSVVTSPWICSADDGTTVSQCPLKDGQAEPCSQSAKTPGLATMGPSCSPKCFGSLKHHKTYLNRTVITVCNNGSTLLPTSHR